jgi:hypothetical protein
MINTEEDSDYAYLSNEFTLLANGSYYVTVSVKTIGDNSVASVFLMEGGAIYKDCIIDNISTTGWSNYTFFVQTNSYESVTLKFGMQIGSQNTRASGCVLFDELHAGQISVSADRPDRFRAFRTSERAYAHRREDRTDKEGKQRCHPAEQPLGRHLPSYALDDSRNGTQRRFRTLDFGGYTLREYLTPERGDEQQVTNKNSRIRSISTRRSAFFFEIPPRMHTYYSKKH